MKNPKVIFEDNWVLVIDKPSGLVVNRAESVKGKTLQDWVEERVKLEGSEVFLKRSGVVHRLDKDTSGVMVLAKNEKAFVGLQRQFKERKVKKKYLALVHGVLEPKVGDIKLPLGRKPSDRKKFGVRIRGKMAKTEYLRKEIYRKGEKRYSLVELKPETGRTHQLRVHLKHLGYPIAGDVIYLSKKRLKQDQEWCSRLFLEAKSLSFIHPKTGKREEYEVELAKDLKESLGKLTND